MGYGIYSEPTLGLYPSVLLLAGRQFRLITECAPTQESSNALVNGKNLQPRFAFDDNSLYGSNNCSAGRQNVPARFNLSLTAVIQ